MLQGARPAIEPFVYYQGIGDDIDLTAIGEAQILVHQELAYEMSHYTYDKDRDRLEGKAAVILYNSLHNINAAVLDDSGFWRYLSLKHFWHFIAWREEGAFKRDNFLKYVDGENYSEGVLNRMFLRVCALGGSRYGHLAWMLPHATDFWRSHILRVRTGTAPPVTRALVRKYGEERLNTEELREFAKRLNRLWTNVLLNTYSDHEARDLIDELWP